MKRITIEDVAKAAGVSRQTVSRAMNDKGEISPETKERVMRAIDELGYVPNRMAQGMVTRSTRTIGLIIGDVMNLFFAEVARGVQDLAQAHDYHVILYNTDNNRAIEERALRSLLAQGVDGIIGFISVADDVLTAIADQGKPIVLINRSFAHANVATVMVDNQQGARLAVAYLLQQGHRQIGMLAPQDALLKHVRRYQGYQETLHHAGVEQNGQWVARGYPTLEGGYAATKELLNRSPDISALFTYTDLMALGAIRAARELGRNVPTDLAIVGYDDSAIAALTNPALTTIQVQKYEMGKQAMQQFLAMNDEATDVEFASLNVALIIRESA
ncbi:MAG: LacI family DNA-binding transcriptional regulator [Caldilineaceae bacterium]